MYLSQQNFSSALQTNVMFGINECRGKLKPKNKRIQ